MDSCFECLSEIPSEASVCSHCGTRIKGILCQVCRSYCPFEAKKCKHCGSTLLNKTTALINQKTVAIDSELLPTLLVELSLTPQRVVITKDKLIITSYSLLGLISHDEEIPWEKVAGFSHRSGIFWDTIAIETRGQTSARIACLSRSNAGKIKQVLQQLE